MVVGLYKRYLTKRTIQDFQIIFNELINHVVELMTNPFGNYPMQKLLEVCSEEQRTKNVNNGQKERERRNQKWHRFWFIF